MVSRIFKPGDSAAETQSAIIAEDWKLLRYFSVYRLIVALSAAVYAVLGEKIPPFGESDPQLFLVASLIYAGLALASMETLRRRRPAAERQCRITGRPSARPSVKWRRRFASWASIGEKTRS